MKIYYALRQVVKFVTGQPAPHPVNTAGSNYERMGILKPCDHQNTCLVSPTFRNPLAQVLAQTNVGYPLLGDHLHG